MRIRDTENYKEEKYGKGNKELDKEEINERKNNKKTGKGQRKKKRK